MKLLCLHSLDIWWEREETIKYMLIAHVYSKHSWCSLMDHMHFFSLTSLDPSTLSSIAKITNMLFACNIVLCIHQHSDCVRTLSCLIISVHSLFFFALYIQIYSPRCWLACLLVCLLACLLACLHVSSTQSVLHQFRIPIFRLIPMFPCVPTLPPNRPSQYSCEMVDIFHVICCTLSDNNIDVNVHV